MSAMFKHLGESKKPTPQIGGSRFSDRFFQTRIKSAREFKRAPRFLPSARTNITIGVLSRKTKFISSLIVILLLGGAVFVVFSPRFRITEIKAEGLSQLQLSLVSSWITELGDEKILKFIPGNHLIALSRSRVETRLKEKSILIVAVPAFKKHFPNKLELSISERYPAFIWKTGDQYALVSNDGLVLDEVAESYASTTTEFITFEDQSGTVFNLHDPLAARQAVRFIPDLIKLWPAFVSFALLDGTVSGSVGSDIFVSTEQEFKVYFSSSRNAEDQLHFLQLILAYEIPPERIPELAYIDVRLEEQAYYCYVSEPCESVSSPDSPEKVDD